MLTGKLMLVPSLCDFCRKICAAHLFSIAGMTSGRRSSVFATAALPAATYEVCFFGMRFNHLRFEVTAKDTGWSRQIRGMHQLYTGKWLVGHKPCLNRCYVRIGRAVI
jgi:hypothetical protein